MIRSAGIIAAGEGRRLKMEGLKVSKPLIPIAGTPLIGHTLRQFLEIGVDRVAIIFNETQEECVDWVRAHFTSLKLQILVKTTRSSFESFWRIGRALGPGRHLISTVDSICSTTDWRTMFGSEVDSERDILLGVTSFVHDEKPLWVRTEPESLRIVSLGVPMKGSQQPGSMELATRFSRESGRMASRRSAYSWDDFSGRDFPCEPCPSAMSSMWIRLKTLILPNVSYPR